MPKKTKTVWRRTWGLRMVLYSALFLTGAGIIAFVLLASRGASDGRPSRFEPIHRFDTADYHSLALDPTQPRLVLFGHHGGVQMSRDGGDSWETVIAEEGRDAMNLVYDPFSPATIYMAGHEVYYRSDNGGETWQPVESNLPGLDLHAFIASPTEEGRLYAFAVGYGLFRSDDGGESWELLSGDVQAASIVELPDETLLVAAGDAGILRSDDSGKTWASSGAGLEAGVAFTVRGDPDGRRLYAGTDRGLLVSTDGGRTWTPTSLDDTTALVVGVNPTDPIEVLVVNLDGQLYRSTDGGATW